MRLSPGTRDRVATRGVRFLSSLELKPGRYHLKIAASDAAGRQTRGVVQHDVTVPDLRKGPVTLSGIALASVAHSGMSTNGSADRWKPLGMPPTTAREFEPSDELRAYIQVYTVGTTTVTTTVRSSSGRTLFSSNQRLPQALSDVEREVVSTIPLKDMTSGDYVLRVEARNPAFPDQPALQQVRFRIR